MRKLLATLAALALLAAAPVAALAQGPGGGGPGPGPPPSPWVVSGATINPQNFKVLTNAPTTSIAGFNLPHGVAPTSPVNGDLWTTAAGIFVRISGATIGPLVDSAHVPVVSVFGRTGVVTAQSGDYTVAQVTGAAPLASPALTGIPTAPTAAPGTNTTQLATTAFVQAATTLGPCTAAGAFLTGLGAGASQCSTVAGSVATLSGGPLTLNVTSNTLGLGLLVNQGVAGTYDSGISGRLDLNNINISDVANVAGNPGVSGFTVNYAYGASPATGPRSAFTSNFNFVGATTGVNANHFYISNTANLTVRSADGGTNTGAGSLGSFIASSINITTLAAATNLAEVSGQEIIVTVAAGSTMRGRQGLEITDASDAGSAQGTSFDNAIRFDRSGSAPGFQKGLNFVLGGVSATGTAIGTESAPTFGTFIDASGATLTNYFLRSPGFSVDGSGVVSVGSTATVNGLIVFNGHTSGAASVTAQAVQGTPTLTLPTGSGTFAVSASAPLSLDATTGNLSCATCDSRTPLSASLDLYVTTGGSDANTCTLASPCATLQRAYSYFTTTYDTKGNNTTIHVAAGTYSWSGSNCFVIKQAWIGGGLLSIIGDTTTPDNVVISATSCAAIDVETSLPSATFSPAIQLVANLTAGLLISGFKLQTTTGGQGINHNGSGDVVVGNMDYATTVNPHNVTQSVGARIIFGADYTISGNAPAHRREFFPSVIEAIAAITVTVKSLPTFSGHFAEATNGGVDYTGPPSAVQYKDQSGHVRQDATASTHTNTTLDSISINTNLLTVGMAVVGSGIPSSPVTTIQNINSSSSITLSQAATATAAGVAVSFEIAVGPRCYADTNGIVNANNPTPTTPYLPGTSAGGSGGTGGQCLGQ